MESFVHALKWLAAIGALGAIGKILYDYREGIRVYIVDMVWAAFNPVKIGKFKTMSEQSRHAELCPNCDARMKVDSSSISDQWNWHCKVCGQYFWINMHAKKGR